MRIAPTWGLYAMTRFRIVASAFLSPASLFFWPHFGQDYALSPSLSSSSASPRRCLPRVFRAYTAVRDKVDLPETFCHLQEQVLLVPRPLSR